MANKHAKDFGTGSGLSDKQRRFKDFDTMNPKHKDFVSKAENKGKLSEKLKSQLA